MSKKKAIKVLLIGDASVGKTCIFKSFSKKPYNDQTTTTVGVDFVFEDVEVDGETIKLQLWDTAGHERFDTITTSYYRGAHGIILCSSCDNLKSFQSIDKWIRKVNENEQKAIIFLVQTKCDILEGDREVSESDFKFRALNRMCALNLMFSRFSRNNVYEK
ncbi:hypothetical protein A3Q56_07655 [Intoshia linei]|uniref:Uncharacterized protein n=1 Tax=Intoshia linei TaxID=1819745 RepID=A0A177ATB6_9BILA|nr:hypothetical protein A3Q56_07655 [Intoshia linei]